jgi:hypothetical protein
MPAAFDGEVDDFESLCRRGEKGRDHVQQR